MVQNYIDGSRQANGGSQRSIAEGRNFGFIELGKLLLSAAAADKLQHTPGRAGRILAILAICEVPTTDTNGDGTITAEINGTAVTGGVLSVADVNDGTNPVTTVDQIFQGTRITAANEFKPGDYVDVAWAVTNAFGDGEVRVLLFVEWDTD